MFGCYCVLRSGTCCGTARDWGCQCPSRGPCRTQRKCPPIGTRNRCRRGLSQTSEVRDASRLCSLFVAVSILLLLPGEKGSALVAQAPVKCYQYLPGCLLLSCCSSGYVCSLMYDPPSRRVAFVCGVGGDMRRAAFSPSSTQYLLHVPIQRSAAPGGSCVVLLRGLFLCLFARSCADASPLSCLVVCSITRASPGTGAGAPLPRSH